MNDSSLPPTLASALYLRLAEFDERPAAEQAAQRAQLAGCARTALQGLTLADRLVLKAVDGLIVVVLDNPEGALDVAGRCLQAAEDVVPLQIGLAHGVVTPVAEGEAIVGMIGEGIETAASACGYAAPGQLRITDSFRDALACRAPGRAALLSPAGSFSGSQGRPQALFAPGVQAPAQRRHRLLVGAGVIALLLLAVGLIGGVLLVRPALLAFDIKPSGQVSVDGQRIGEAPPLTQYELPHGPHRIVVRYRDHEPLRVDLDLEPGETRIISHDFAPPAVLLFDIKPGGEVFVDGVSRGQIPGLERLEVAAGEHRLEVVYGSQPPLSVTISPKPDQQLMVRYQFAEEPPPKPKAPPRKTRGKR